ncbi:Uncharacterized protein HZ326_4045 [Fusarium oxysporum f. sp. albedinis]|nr:Uncharacterized protein HZ326_4045 [Fusarium oxysporum f. sp. albedinis]
MKKSIMDVIECHHQIRVLCVSFAKKFVSSLNEDSQSRKSSAADIFADRWYMSGLDGLHKVCIELTHNPLIR